MSASLRLDLILEVHTKLTELFGDYDLHQIKEKFGGLRYYVAWPEGYTEDEYKRLNGLVSFVEAFSYRICEECGRPGK